MNAIPFAEITDELLESTDQISYEFSNLVQPHACFLSIDRNQSKILNVSENCRDWFGVEPHQVVGQRLDDRLVRGIVAFIQECGQPNRKDSINLSMDTTLPNGTPLYCRLVPGPGRWMVELERWDHADDCKCNLDALQTILFECLRSSRDFASNEDLILHVITQIRLALGYERAMCYQFDEENHGKVIAESMEGAGLPSYLGLHFPARDIPKSVRAMLEVCSLRTTVDQSKDCVAIWPAKDPLTGQYIDLSLIRSRGAAGACRQYYLSMNIRSTLVLPLVIDNRLWGLVAFHDHRVRRVNPSLDVYLDAIIKALTVEIGSRIRNSNIGAEHRGQDVVRAMSLLDPMSDKWLDGLSERIDCIKAALDCSGFLLRVSGKVLAAGKVPFSTEQQDFIDTLFQLSEGRPLVVNSLAKLDSGLARYASVAAGVVAVPLVDGRDDIAIWLRPDQTLAIQWAGDPDAPGMFTSADGRRSGPRGSFEIWSQTTRLTCSPWSDQDRVAGLSCARQIGLLTLSWYASLANRSKTQFLSCISHELRTPMTAILGYTNLLRESFADTNADDPTVEFVEIIQRNGEHLLAIIDDVLDLAKIESGKLNVEQIEVAVMPLIDEVVQLMRVRAASKRLFLKVETLGKLPSSMFTDPIRLRQILINLIGNAIKFTEEGTVTLRVSASQSSGRILFEVIDTGIGLTTAQIAKLFRAFEQADVSTTRRFGGSGLGLQISKNLAELLGGTISVTSDYGLGSEFRVNLPIGLPDASSDSQAMAGRAFPDQVESAKVPQIAVGTDLHGAKIAVVEDGVDNQRLIRHLLTKAGATVVLYDNGRIALENLTVDGTVGGTLPERLPFDLIITDMQMPELDGFELARSLKRGGCSTPIIALTALTMQSNLDECMEAGCDDCLPKPFRPDALLAICRKWIAERSLMETPK